MSAGCPVLVEGRAGYCPAHDPGRDRRPWEGRAPAQDRGYGWAWSKVRKRRLHMDGFRCQVMVDGRKCLRPAVQVDHVESTARGMERGKREWTVDEVRSICDEHHRVKSEQERVEGLRLAAQRRRGRGGR